MNLVRVWVYNNCQRKWHMPHSPLRFPVPKSTKPALKDFAQVDAWLARVCTKSLLSAAETDNEAQTAPGSEMSKMIDWSRVLDLDSKDEEKIDAAFSKLNVYERSFNQSLSYMKRSPLVVDLEIKK